MGSHGAAPFRLTSAQHQLGFYHGGTSTRFLPSCNINWVFTIVQHQLDVLPSCNINWVFTSLQHQPGFRLTAKSTGFLPHCHINWVFTSLQHELGFYVTATSTGFLLHCNISWVFTLLHHQPAFHLTASSTGFSPHNNLSWVFTSLQHELGFYLSAISSGFLPHCNTNWVFTSVRNQPGSYRCVIPRCAPDPTQTHPPTSLDPVCVSFPRRGFDYSLTTFPACLSAWLTVTRTTPSVSGDRLHPHPSITTASGQSTGDARVQRNGSHVLIAS